jgi:hemerythrin
MEPFFWKQSYDTGLKQIDRDHRTILELANTLYNAIHNDDGRAAVLQSCRDIVEFTEKHFALEEQYMATSAYAETEAHALEHGRLKEEARRLLLRLELDTPGSATGLYHVLRELFIEHIPEWDKPFCAYYLSRRKEGPEQSAKT